MNFENDSLYEKAGKSVGFVSMFLFTTLVVYFIFSFAHKLPTGWNYISIAMIFVGLFLIGTLLKQELEA